MSANKNTKKKAKNDSDSIKDHHIEDVEPNSGKTSSRYNRFIENSCKNFESIYHTNKSTYSSKKIVTNLVKNINDSFENNLILGQDCLKCTTASNFVEIQRRFFEYNFQSAVKAYNDFIDDIQRIYS